MLCRLDDNLIKYDKYVIGVQSTGKSLSEQIRSGRTNGKRTALCLSVDKAHNIEYQTLTV